MLFTLSEQRFQACSSYFAVFEATAELDSNRLEPNAHNSRRSQMNTNLCRRLVIMVSSCLSVCFMTGMFSGVANAQVLINQADALAGNVTPGDAPGFPVTISQPGSYRLSSNLDVPSHGLGIDIQADDVSIDLNGFRIRGNAMSGRAIAAGAAPIPSSGFKGIVVRN